MQSVSEFRIVLPKRVYAPGERIEGQVVLSTNAPISCKALRIQLEHRSTVHWHTGSGDNRRDYHGTRACAFSLNGRGLWRLWQRARFFFGSSFWSRVSSLLCPYPPACFPFPSPRRCLRATDRVGPGPLHEPPRQRRRERCVGHSVGPERRSGRYPPVVCLRQQSRHQGELRRSAELRRSTRREEGGSASHLRT